MLAQLRELLRVGGRQYVRRSLEVADAAAGDALGKELDVASFHRLVVGAGHHQHRPPDGGQLLVEVLVPRWAAKPDGVLDVGPVLRHLPGRAPLIERAAVEPRLLLLRREVQSAVAAAAAQRARSRENRPIDYLSMADREPRGDPPPQTTRRSRSPARPRT